MMHHNTRSALSSVVLPALRARAAQRAEPSRTQRGRGAGSKSCLTPPAPSLRRSNFVDLAGQVYASPAGRTQGTWRPWLAPVRSFRAPPARQLLRSLPWGLPRARARELSSQGDPAGAYAGPGGAGGGRGGAEGRRFPFHIWPGAGAALFFGATLFSARYFSTDEIWKEVVKQLPKRDGLRTLQLIIMLFGGRWTEEVRTRLASNGCVEALIPLLIRLDSELKESTDRLEQGLQLRLDEQRLVGMQQSIAAAFARREVCTQALAIVMDGDIGRARFFAHDKHGHVMASVLSSSDSIDWSALTNSYRAGNDNSGQARKPVLPPSARSGWFVRKRQPDDSEPAATEDEHVRPWTASEALLVASLAGDERGQKAIFSSSVALPTIRHLPKVNCTSHHRVLLLAARVKLHFLRA